MKKLFQKILLALSLFLLLEKESIASSEKLSEDDSIYGLSIHLTDQDGKKLGLDVYKGQYVVMSLFYASCNYTCPILIDALKKMDAALDEKTRLKTRILLISFDPENDTPAVLKKLALQHKLDLSRWKLASPEKNEVRDIAALLGFTYRSIPEGGFNHTSGVTLLNPLGIPLLQEEGLARIAELIPEKLKKEF